MKKLTSLLASVLTAAALLTPMSTSAETLVPKDKFTDYTNGFTKVENVHFLDWGKTSQEDFEAVYINATGTQIKAFQKVDGVNNPIIELKDAVEADTIVSALKNEFEVKYSLGKYPDLRRGWYIRPASEKQIISTGEADKLISFLKEKDLITSGFVFRDLYSAYIFNGKQNTYYTIEQGSDVFDILSDYVSNKLEGYSVETADTNYIKLICPEGTSIVEQVKTEEQIYEDTGKRPYYIVRNSGDNVVGVNRIDIFNAVKGDANCDGNATIADAVAILQSIGNHDKYALTAQGEFNGDLTGDYDGITASDALAIQQLDSQGEL